MPDQEIASVISSVNFLIFPLLTLFSFFTFQFLLFKHLLWCGCLNEAAKSLDGRFLVRVKKRFDKKVKHAIGNDVQPFKDIELISIISIENMCN